MAHYRARINLVQPGSTDDSDARTDGRAVILNGYAYNNGAGQPCVRKRPGINYIGTAGSGSYRAIHMRETGTGFSVTSTRFEDLAGSSLGTTFSNNPSTAFTSQGEMGSLTLVTVPEEGTYGKTYTVSSGGTVTARFTGTPNSATEYIAAGCALMDTFGFVLSEDGYIYNSAAADLTSWPAANRINMQFSDVGKFCCHHLNHIVAMGGTSIEFFYNSGATSGSILLPRRDNVIKATAMAYWSNNMDAVAWVDGGLDGSIGVYMLAGWDVRKISSIDIDRHLQRMQAAAGLSTVKISGMYVHGKLLIFLQLVDESSNTIVKVYDPMMNAWYEWILGTSSTFFPVDTAQVAETADDYYVIFGNTHLFALNDSLAQDDTDSVTTQSYEFAIITDSDYGPGDDGTLRKTANQLGIVGSLNSNVTITVSYSDDDYGSFTSAGTISLGSRTNKLNRLGDFYERAWKFSNTSAYPIELYSAWYSGEVESPANTDERG